MKVNQARLRAYILGWGIGIYPLAVLESIEAEGQHLLKNYASGNLTTYQEALAVRAATAKTAAHLIRNRHRLR